ncbi:hypothetical protein CLOP_g5916 [Closterium sp. NIES-67]|nr:hypothetical protein CLOP_g5916 [Closterium sp. NIES-67]
MCIDAPDAGIDFYTTFYLRMVDLHTVLVMEGYDVSFVAVQEAMTDNNYNDKFKRRRFGQLVSTWGSAKPPPGVHSGQPFANKIFFQAASTMG